MPHLDEIVACLQSHSAEVQLNAAAYLQHVTYQNEDNKERIRTMEGIPALISMLNSRSSTCQVNAACVLRNLSNGSNNQIKNQMKQCGCIEIIESLLENSHQLDRKLTEAIIAILCNLSCNIAFQVPIVSSALTKVVQHVFLPFIGIKLNLKTMTILPFIYSDLSFPYSSLLDYITTFLKNLSSGTQYIRQQLRNCVGLIDAVIAIILHSPASNSLDTTIVENCACIVRNLCYAIQEIVDPDYLTKKLASETSAPTKNGKRDMSRGGSNSSKEILLSPRSIDADSPQSHASFISGVALLLGNGIIDALLLLINDCCNYSTIEAAVGAVQNLAACNWPRADAFRKEFRKKKGLPSLVVQLNNGPDDVIKVALAAFRNLAQDDRNFDLVGKHCLYHLIRLLPSQTNPIVKRTVITGPENHEVQLPEEYIGLNTIFHTLSLIYFILKSNHQFCTDFVEINGVKCCMFLLCSDSFYKEHLLNCNPRQSDNADRIPILCASILQRLWSVSDLVPSLKKDKWTCEDFCVQTIASELKSNLSCSKGDGAKSNAVYYGKPYMKARGNTLLPWTFKFSQRQPNTSRSIDYNLNSDAESLQRNSIMPNFLIENVDNEMSQSQSVQRGYANDIQSRDKLYPEREADVRPSRVSREQVGLYNNW